MVRAESERNATTSMVRFFFGGAILMDSIAICFVDKFFMRLRPPLEPKECSQSARFSGTFPGDTLLYCLLVSNFLNKGR